MSGRAIREHHFPVFAAGVGQRRPYEDGPGEIDGPVATCGMVVAPGSLRVGDEDGFVSVPSDRIEAVYAEAGACRRTEETQMAAIVAGTEDCNRVDRTPTRLVCEIEA